MLTRRRLVVAAAATPLLGLGGCADDRRPMRILVGSGAGSASDSLARLFAAYVQDRYGQRIEVENEARAGGKLATQRLAKAGPDARIMAFLPTGLIYAALLGEAGIGTDIAALGWLGSFCVDHRALVLVGARDVRKFDDLAGRSKPAFLAVTNTTAPAFYEARIISYLTGAKLKSVAGFTGGARNLALVSGEVDGIVASLDGLRSVLDLPGARIVLRVSGPTASGGSAPSLVEKAHGSDVALLTGLVDAHAQLGRIVALPPGAPKRQLDFWRDRFLQTVADPAFRKLAAGRGFAIEPTSGEQVSATLRALLSEGSSQTAGALRRAMACESTPANCWR